MRHPHQNNGNTERQPGNAQLPALTVCKLCGDKFAAPPAIVLGQSSTTQYLEEITRHFVNRHKDHERAVSILALEYLGVLRMMNFRTADQDLFNQIDFVRWKVHQKTLAARIPDDRLEARTQEVANRLLDTVWAMLTMVYDQRSEAMPDFVEMLKPAVRAEIATLLIDVFKGIRDVLEEPNKYQLPNVTAP